MEKIPSRIVLQNNLYGMDTIVITMSRPLVNNLLGKWFQVDDSVPEEGKIEWAVKRLRNNHSRGRPGMRAEHIKR